jgi:hypothetical protein
LVSSPGRTTLHQQNMKMWRKLHHDTVEWRALPKRAVDLQVPQKQRNIFIN